MNRVLYAIYLAAVLAIAHFVFNQPGDVGGAPAADSRESVFVKTAAQSGSAQIQISFDAAELARSSEVREFASAVVESQRPMLEDLQQLAAGRQIVIPPIPEAPAAPGDGTGAVPADYDRAFLQRQIELHEQALEFFAAEAASELDSDLRAYAWMSAAQLEERLQQGKELLRKVSGPARKGARNRSR